MLPILSTSIMGKGEEGLVRTRSRGVRRSRVALRRESRNSPASIRSTAFAQGYGGRIASATARPVPAAAQRVGCDFESALAEVARSNEALLLSQTQTTPHQSGTRCGGAASSRGPGRLASDAMGVSTNPLVGREECTRQLARLRVARSASEYAIRAADDAGSSVGSRRPGVATRRRATRTLYVRAQRLGGDDEAPSAARAPCPRADRVLSNTRASVVRRSTST